MSCPRCYNTAITGMLHGCAIIENMRQDTISKRSNNYSFFTQAKETDKELESLIDQASEGVEY